MGLATLKPHRPEGQCSITVWLERLCVWTGYYLTGWRGGGDGVKRRRAGMTGGEGSGSCQLSKRSLLWQGHWPGQPGLSQPCRPSPPSPQQLMTRPQLLIIRLMESHWSGTVRASRGPCVSNGIILKEGGGWGMKQVALKGRYFFKYPSIKKSRIWLIN